jgi:mevalonate kinase
MTDSMSPHSYSARAWGKVILLGEHAVVYGVPAIAVGIDRCVTAAARPLPSGPSRLSVTGWEVDVAEDDPQHDLARALGAVLAMQRGRSAVPFHARVDIESELPPGGGLGCSAAMGVAVARALDPRAHEDCVAERAMAWERVFHGNPSGVDAAVAAQGGCLLFERGHAPERLRAKGGLLLCVGSTGFASSTKAMVESVARLRERRPDMVAKSFDGIRALVRNARLAIEAKDLMALGRLMDLNQMILSGLFVSSEEIEHMCALARTAGALGAKLTGAGGGGSVVALAGSVTVADRVLSAWKTGGFDAFVTRVAGVDVDASPLSLSDSAP